MLLLCVLLLELGARVQLARKTGVRTLLYGTPWHRNERIAVERGDSKLHQAQAGDLHTVNAPRGNRGSGYTKFFPGETRSTYDVDTRETFPVRINASGFRGRDFPAHKAQGRMRVLALGSSSTFGYYDRDEETYPSLLEEELKRRCGPDAFEVLNFGIPHLTSDEIAALFREEGLALDPDVVTLYAGNNDSLELPPSDQRPGGRLGRARRALLEWLSAWGEHLLSVRFALYLAASQDAVGADRQWVASLARQRSEFFLENIQNIAELSRQRGVVFIATSQQKKAASWWPSSAEYRARMRTISYDQEVRSLSERLSETGHLDNFEISMLVHARMMDDLEQWAGENGVPFVDLIQTLDGNRDLLLSNVHLHPEANRMIAARLGQAITGLVGCARAASAPAELQP